MKIFVAIVVAGSFAMLLVSLYFMVRNEMVFRFRMKIIHLLYEDIRDFKQLDAINARLRREASYDRMYKSFEPLRLEYWYGADKLLPIPITKEILEKNGFKGEMYAFLDISPNLYLEYYYHEHRLREWWTGIDEWNNHAEVKEIVFKCQCHYIHELQHALRLCGIEKEIEL